jgi:hypothetical protein
MLHRFRYRGIKIVLVAPLTTEAYKNCISYFDTLPLITNKSVDHITLLLWHQICSFTYIMVVTIHIPILLDCRFN